jgi:hypothetical protein
MKEYGKRLRLSEEEVELIYENRAESTTNTNGNTALDINLAERGIDKKDVVSVKHWQSASGEFRFSIVTKEDITANETDILKTVSSFIENHSPHYPSIKRKIKLNNHLLVINPADIHIGKYANHLETGDGYNVEIACERVLEGLQGLIDKSKGFEVDRVLFCVGNDILHIDNVYNTTTAGTNQDVDGKWWEHFEIALALYVKCVEILREIAPVDVIHSMSNHDYQSGFHLAHALKSWFRNDSEVTFDISVAHRKVTFDISVAHRKYYKYGKNLIGLEHGDGAKMANLPLTMAQERPLLWSETTHRYWYLHHLHHKVKHKWLDAKGYVGVPRAVEGFLHQKDSGQVARLVHYF